MLLKLIKHETIKRIAKLTIFIIIIIASDQIIGKLLRYLYFNQKAGQQQSLSYVLSDVKSEILIFGNSRALQHYDSQIISESLKLSCYNAGQDGGHSILLSYAQIKVITERYSPKIVILEFHPNNIVSFPGDYDKLSVLLPYFSDYTAIRPVILLRSPYERLKLFSAIYPFNSNLINIIRFNTNTLSSRIKDFEGYVPLKGVMNIDLLKSEPEILTQQIVDTNMVNALKNIISICNKKKINLFIISSPIFHTGNDKQSYQTSAAKLSLEIIHHNHVNYLDFSFDTIFAGHIEWFKDKVHLNDEGAKVFTNYIVEVIKNKDHFNRDD